MQLPVNMRHFFQFTATYDSINREERNLAAIFYHLLLLPGNLERFLQLVHCPFLVNEKEMGIYFEYAYIRDLWHHMAADNIQKRAFILSHLHLDNKRYLESCSVEEFNDFFGAVPKASKTYIQSPSNWSIRYFHKNIPQNDEFLKVCRFKWCFNAKPDIVIHTSKDQAICIEAKLESGEGVYPSNAEERSIFKERECPSVKQLSIQKTILQDILGIESAFVFLVQNKSLSETDVVTWKEVFQSLDYSSCPHYIRNWIHRL